MVLMSLEMLCGHDLWGEEGTPLALVQAGLVDPLETIVKRHLALVNLSFGQSAILQPQLSVCLCPSFRDPRTWMRLILVLHCECSKLSRRL